MRPLILCTAVAIFLAFGGLVSFMLTVKSTTREFIMFAQQPLQTGGDWHIHAYMCEDTHACIYASMYHILVYISPKDMSLWEADTAHGEDAWHIRASCKLTLHVSQENFIKPKSVTPTAHAPCISMLHSPTISVHMVCFVIHQICLLYSMVFIFLSCALTQCCDGLYLSCLCLPLWQFTCLSLSLYLCMLCLCLRLSTLAVTVAVLLIAANIHTHQKKKKTSTHGFWICFFCLYECMYACMHVWVTRQQIMYIIPINAEIYKSHTNRYVGNETVHDHGGNESGTLLANEAGQELSENRSR